MHQVLRTGVGRLFQGRAGSQIFGLCSPDGPCYRDCPLPMSWESSTDNTAAYESWCVLVKPELQKQVVGPFAHGLKFPEPCFATEDMLLKR